MAGRSISGYAVFASICPFFIALMNRQIRSKKVDTTVGAASRELGLPEYNRALAIAGRTKEQSAEKLIQAFVLAVE